jgi:hypothetical protein
MPGQRPGIYPAERGKAIMRANWNWRPAVGPGGLYLYYGPEKVLHLRWSKELGLYIIGDDAQPQELNANWRTAIDEARKIGEELRAKQLRGESMAASSR